MVRKGLTQRVGDLVNRLTPPTADCIQGLGEAICPVTQRSAINTQVTCQRHTQAHNTLGKQFAQL